MNFYFIIINIFHFSDLFSPESVFLAHVCLIVAYELIFWKTCKIILTF